PALRLPADAIVMRRAKNSRSLRPGSRWDTGKPGKDPAVLVHPAQVPASFRRPSRPYRRSRGNRDARPKPWPECFFQSHLGPSARALRRAERAGSIRAQSPDRQRRRASFLLSIRSYRWTQNIHQHGRFANRVKGFALRGSTAKQRRIFTSTSSTRSKTTVFPENSFLIDVLALTNMGLDDKAAALALGERALAIESDALNGPTPIEILARVPAQMGSLIARLPLYRNCSRHRTMAQAVLTYRSLLRCSGSIQCSIRSGMIRDSRNSHQARRKEQRQITDRATEGNRPFARPSRSRLPVAWQAVLIVHNVILRTSDYTQ